MPQKSSSAAFLTNGQALAADCDQCHLAVIVGLGATDDPLCQTLAGD